MIRYFINCTFPAQTSERRLESATTHPGMGEHLVQQPRSGGTRQTGVASSSSSHVTPPSIASTGLNNGNRVVGRDVGGREGGGRDVGGRDGDRDGGGRDGGRDVIESGGGGGREPRRLSPQKMNNVADSSKASKAQNQVLLVVLKDNGMGLRVCFLVSILLSFLV